MKTELIFTTKMGIYTYNEVRYSTDNLLTRKVLFHFCTAVKIDVFVFIESELCPNRSTSKVMRQSGEIVCFISFLYNSILAYSIYIFTK